MKTFHFNPKTTHYFDVMRSPKLCAFVMSARHAPERSPAEITALRERAGMNKSQFAAACGVTHVSVIHWEAGKKRPSRQSRILMAQIEAALDSSDRGSG